MKVPSALSRYVVYPLQERFCHRPTFSYLAELEASSGFPAPRSSGFSSTGFALF